MRLIFMLSLLGIYIMESLFLVLKDSQLAFMLTTKIQTSLLRFTKLIRYLSRCVAEACVSACRHFKTILILLRFKDHSRTHQW